MQRNRTGVLLSPAMSAQIKKGRGKREKFRIIEIHPEKEWSNSTSSILLHLSIWVQSQDDFSKGANRLDSPGPAAWIPPHCSHSPTGHRHFFVTLSQFNWTIDAEPFIDLSFSKTPLFTSTATARGLWCNKMCYCEESQIVEHLIHLSSPLAVAGQDDPATSPGQI